MKVFVALSDIPMLRYHAVILSLSIVAIGGSDVSSGYIVGPKSRECCLMRGTASDGGIGAGYTVSSAFSR
jgi:hypothetical protein